jgi:organic radical activating enzyme
MNSSKFIKVRQDMIDGRRPIECEGCWQDEDKGIKSKRQYENERWSHIIPKLEKTAKLKDVNLIYIELRLGNVCNNACLTCNSYSSTKWYPDEKKISNDLPWFQLRPMENFKWFENDEFYLELAEKSQEVEEIYINGGEPTMIKAHFEYLKHLITLGTSQNVHLVYSLNMMDIPDRLIELWKEFKQVTVNASIDDLGERNSGALPNGVYTASFRIVSQDGHPASGELLFTVEDSTAPALVAATDADTDAIAEADADALVTSAGDNDNSSQLQLVLGLSAAGAVILAAVLVIVALRRRRNSASK